MSRITDITRYAPAVVLTQAQKTTSKGDQSVINSAATAPAFDVVSTVDPAAVKVDPSDVGQSMLGFGAALTDSSAYLLMNNLTSAQRTTLLTQLFSPAQGNLSTVRVCIGDSDFRVDPQYYTYADTADNSVDLTGFSIARDLRYIIPVLHQIQNINPAVRFIGSMWSPPAGMKTLKSGATSLDIAEGGFNSAYYQQLAQYWVLALQAYQSFGITFHAITGQNEPTATYAGRPSMLFTNAQAAAFYGPILRPALDAAGFSGVKLWPCDSSWDPAISDSIVPGILGSSTEMQGIDAVSYHGYSGDPYTAQGPVRRAGKSVHLCEIRTLLSQSWTSSVRQMTGVMCIDAIRAGAESVTFWNLALDENGQPTQGSTGRRGVVTVKSDGSGVAMKADGVTFDNAPDLYSLLHIAPYLRAGARRIGSTHNPAGLKTVAFQNLDGEIVLVVYNASAAPITTQIGDARTGQAFTDTFGVGDVVTYRWGTTKTASPTLAPTTVVAPDAPMVAASPAKLTMNVTITPGTNAGTTPTGWFRLLCSINGGAASLVSLVKANGTSPVTFADRRTQVTTSSTYAYTAIAVASKPSASSAATAAGSPLAGTVPGRPTAVAATPGSSSAVVTWSAPTDDGGSNITGYTVTRQNIAAGTTTTFTATSRTARSFTDTTATAGTNYTYTVTATNGIGTSAASDPSGQITPFASAALSLVQTFTSTAQTAYSFSVTPNAGDQLIVVEASYATFDSNTGSLGSINYGGTPMTKLLSFKPGTAQPGGDRCIDLWYTYVSGGLTAQATTVDITWTRGGGTNTHLPNIGAAAMTFRGVGAVPTCNNVTGGQIASGASGTTSLQTNTAANAAKNLLVSVCSIRASNGTYPTMTESGATRVVQQSAGGQGGTGLSANNEANEVWTQPGSTSAQTSTITGIASTTYTQALASFTVPGS